MKRKSKTPNKAYLRSNFKNLMKHGQFLNSFATIRDKKAKKALVGGMTDAQIRAAKELFSGVLNGKIPIDKGLATKLARHKNVLRQISNRGTSLKKTKKLLKQKGGFLPLLAMAPLAGKILAPLAASVLGGLLK